MLYDIGIGVDLFGNDLMILGAHRIPQRDIAYAEKEQGAEHEEQRIPEGEPEGDFASELFKIF